MSLHENSQELPSERGVPGIYWDEGYANPAFLRSVPLTPWDERALARIEEHLAVEAEASKAYEAFTRAEDPAVKYLAQLIAEDERRHHQVLARIAEVLRAEVSDVASPVPEVEVSAEQRKELLDETHQLLDMEKADAVALKELRHELRAAPEGTLWPVLVEMMTFDTDKHIHLLKSIERHLAARHYVR